MDLAASSLAFGNLSPLMVVLAKRSGGLQPNVAAGLPPRAAGADIESSRSPTNDRDVSADRMVALMRFLLATCGLLTVVLDPSEPDRLVAATYLCLIAYCAYSGAIYHAVIRNVAPGLVRWAHWIDLAWFTVLIALSSGTNSIFFFGFLFSIMVAAFRWGFVSGLRVTAASVLLFGTVGYVWSPAESFELNRFLIRPAYLVVMGYLMSHWGGYQLALLRRLALLKEVAALSNPRFGIDRTVEQVLERLRTYYGADSIVVLTREEADGAITVRRRSARSQDGNGVATLPPTALSALLAFGDADAFAVRRRSPDSVERSDAPGRSVSLDVDVLKNLLEALDAGTVITVPWPDRNQAGRLFLVWNRRRSLPASDVDFCRDVVNHVMPTIDNVRMVDRLATEAAETERQRIARDLHDSVIQPYIGLRMSLRGIRERLAQRRDVAGDLERLESVVDEEIEQLRGYLSEIRSPAASGGIFENALHRFAERFGEVTGIRVHVNAAGILSLNDRLAAEAFQIIVEALSNVRRHTSASAATVAVSVEGNELHLRIVDSGEGASLVPAFTPRSIADRVAALGGTFSIDRGSSATSVAIVIPL